MPSLKTLRISRDTHILGTLSFLDAPLLEVLVLHRVNLSWAYVGQDIRDVTTFVQFDTIVLLDCYRDGEERATVDMVLNTLARRATHIIISSNAAPNLKRENLLDFKQCDWPRLQRITLDLELSPYSESRVVEPVFEQWNGQVGGLMGLDKVCNLEIKVGDSMMNEPWPASGGVFSEDGNVENCFIWGETLRAKGG